MRKKIYFLILTSGTAAIIISAGAYLLFFRNHSPRADLSGAELRTNPSEETNPDASAAANQKNSANNPEFLAAVNQLDSAEKVSDYLKNNFSLMDNESDSALAPTVFFAKKTGGPQDAAVFAAYVLKQHGFETGVLIYRGEKNNLPFSHAVAVFRGADVPKYLTAGNGGIEIIAHGWSFNDLLKKEEERTGSVISEYSFLEPGTTNLAGGEWVKK
ncbi:MAG: hypothetical protein NTX14_04090 [Candidatus Nealsonbacteria bacterium]|nr:hypothetical protein [Candidatus Nealsonbacteria bacterium]